jgi:hypothetical protein
METTEKIVEKKVYEEGKKEYATRGTGNAGLTLGIIGTALGGIAAASIWGKAGSGQPNVTSGQVAEVTSFAAYNKECGDVLNLTNELWSQKVNTMEQFFASRQTDNAEKFSLWKGQVDADFGLYKGYRDMGDTLTEEMNKSAFGLYKAQRDSFDVLSGRISCLEKEVAVNAAIRPYQDKLIQCEIEKAYTAGVNYTDKKTCKCIYGEVVLPSTPTVTGYGSYTPCTASSATA